MAIALASVACASQPTATPTPTVTATPTPTPVLTPTSPPNERSEVRALRLHAEAFALARTEARFEDTYAFTLPSFMEECEYNGWVGWLIADAGVLRAFNGYSDDEPLRWTVRFVDVDGDEGTVVASVSTVAGAGLGIETLDWVRVDGAWWLNEPPEEMCNL